MRPRICRMFIMHVLKFRVSTTWKNLFILGFNIRSNSEQTLESFYLASLGHAIYFGFRLRSNLEQTHGLFTAFTSLPSLIRFIWVQSSAEFRARTRAFLLRFAWPCNLFWLPSPAEFRAKFLKKSASLRSTMRFILASIYCWIHSKHSRASASLRSAKRYIMASICGPI